MTPTTQPERQSAKAHATRPARIEAVTRDLWADVNYYQDTNHEIERQEQ